MREIMTTGRLAEIGRDVRSRIRRMFDVPLEANATPLEIAHAALEDIEGRLQPAGRGVRVLPCSRITVRLRPTSDRAALDATFSRFEDRVRARLRELGCEPPAGFEVKVAVMKKVPGEWPDNQLFAVDYHTAAPSRIESAASTAAPAAVHFTIVKGASAKKAYTFSEPLISIGRTADPTDDLGRVRRNRLAFLDTVDGVTETVGRAHARLQFDEARHQYLLFDEGSSNGTSIARGSTTIHVPARDPRGVRVASGDEIHLGRAVVRISFDGEER
jgi:hypothetical protein